MRTSVVLYKTQRSSFSVCESSHPMQFPAGHGCYRAINWLEAAEPYQIQYDLACEPYTITVNSATPDFDERFRGRLFDKISHLQRMSSLGTEFIVDANNFLLHLPHENVQNIDYFIDWFPANRDKFAVPHTLLHMYHNEIATTRARSSLIHTLMRMQQYMQSTNTLHKTNRL